MPGISSKRAGLSWAAMLMSFSYIVPQFLYRRTSGTGFWLIVPLHDAV